MQGLRRFFWTIIAGALLGVVLFAWASPHVIVWYFSPPADIGISCKPAVGWAIETYRKVLFTGLLLGTIVSGILYFAFGSQRKPEQAAQIVPPDSSDSV
jgi:hypothetical protein